MFVAVTALVDSDTQSNELCAKYLTCLNPDKKYLNQGSGTESLNQIQNTFPFFSFFCFLVCCK